MPHSKPTDDELRAALPVFQEAVEAAHAAYVQEVPLLPDQRNAVDNVTFFIHAALLKACKTEARPARSTLPQYVPATNARVVRVLTPEERALPLDERVAILRTLYL